MPSSSSATTSSRIGSTISMLRSREAASADSYSNLALSSRRHDSDPPVVLRAREPNCDAPPGGRHVTSALTTAQTRELLLAAFVARFLKPAVGTAMRAAYEEVMLAYNLNGYTSRIFGPYKQHALYVGHGRTCRNFRNLSQYDPANLQLSVLGRLYQPSGELVGRGSRESRARSSAAKRRRPP